MPILTVVDQLLTIRALNIGQLTVNSSHRMEQCDHCLWPDYSLVPWDVPWIAGN